MAPGSAAGPNLPAMARYEALIRISNSIRARKEHQELFEILVRELSMVVPFDAIAQFDEAANKIHWHLGSACRDRTHCPSEDQSGESLPSWVFRTQQIVVLGSTLDDGRLPGVTTRVMCQAGLQSVCAVPLTTAHRRLGSLVIASTQPNAYSPEDVRFCTLVADQIALAMDDAVNFQASQKAQERLQLLIDLTNRVVSNLNLRDVLGEISAQVRQVMHCDSVWIGLPSLEDGRFRMYDGEGGAANEEGREATVDEESAPARAFRTGEAMVQSGPEIQDKRARESGIRTAVHVPIKGREGTVGVLCLGTRAEAAFAANDLPFLHQVAHQVAIPIENARAFGEVAEQGKRLEQEKLYLEDELRDEFMFEEIVGRSEALRRVLDEIATVAPTDSTVLIHGETGSGKELVARAVHNLSPRRHGAFVKLNCAAIPTGLLESEMFGHEKGAFTGATAQRIGRFELANGGTMFLDEIGEVPLELQPKLLRVLQEREFERLGSTRTLRTDARLIAATNRDLDRLVEEQRFRPDLYYRLNVFPVRVPALRERPEDIPLLVRHFVQQYSRRLGKTIDAVAGETMTALARYPWPGNIRELQNVIERAVILSSGPVLTVRGSDLRPMNHTAASSAASSQSAAETATRGMRRALEDTERRHILDALEKSKWVVAGPQGAAALLGLKRSTLQSRMQKLGIRVSRTAA